MSLDKNKHLREVLDTHKMHHVQAFVDKVKARREEIKSMMYEHYGRDKYPSFCSGSFAKHTATNVKFDLDLVEPFKHNAFGTLQEMFDNVFDFLSEEYKDNGVEVRKQKVSIGITFPQEDGDDKPVELDVVPGRELSNDDYTQSHDLNLCFNQDHWGFSKGSCQKTNIQKQIDHIKGKTSEREIIRLLKIWKKQKDKKYKSFVIELAVIKALEGYNGDSGLWPKLKYVMEYIRDHITKSSFHLYDPGNSNNDVVNSMSGMERQNFMYDMKDIIDSVEWNEDTLLQFFKKNEQFQEKEDDSGFSNKNDREGYSTPHTSNRFG